MPKPSVAVIGAGLAGLACARALAAAGAAVRLYDKGRAPGGRLATRRVGATEGRAALQFDHGAQYLTARGPAFAAALRGAGAAAWPDAGRLVGVPGMSALPRALLGGLDLSASRHATAIAGRPGAWRVLHLDAARVRPGHRAPDDPPAADGPYDAVLVTAPAPQATPLLGPHAPAMAERLDAVRYAPCWTLMVALAGRPALPDTLRPSGHAIGWAARDSSKPGRDPTAECWVVQGAPGWSREHLEAAPEAAPRRFWPEFTGLAASRPLPGAIHAAAHRWRYSLVEAPLGEPCLWDATLRLGLAGDGCLAGRAEAAFDSGTALAAAVLAA